MTTRWSANDAEATVSWTSGGPNSLVAGSKTGLSDAISNDAATTEREILANFRFTLAAQGSNRSVGASVSLYLVPEVGGTYGSSDAECLDGYCVQSKPLDDASLAAREVIFDGVQLPPTDFKVSIGNDTGVSFAASGNTLKFENYTTEDV